MLRLPGRASRVIEDDYRTAFFWLWLQVVVDATDGVLARARARVRAAALVQRREARRHRRLPDVRVRAGAVRLAGAARARRVGDARRQRDAAVERLRLQPRRREDRRPLLHRLPVVLEHRGLLPVRAGAAAAAQRADAAGAAVLVFVPIRYVYPSRTPVLPVLTNVLGSRLGSGGAGRPVAISRRVARAGARVAGLPGLLRRAVPVPAVSARPAHTA